MKKKYLIYIIILMIIFINIGAGFCQATSITLSQIVEKFNNSEEIKKTGMQLVASASNDILTITTQNSATLQYKLNGNILSANFSANDAFTGALVSIYLADSIGQLHGYSDGEMISTLSSDDIKNYTLEKEGIQISSGTNEECIFKVDITKKIPLMNFDDVYITVSDLSKLEEFLVKGGSAQKSKGKVAFYKSGYENDITLVVGEYPNLTKNAFRSIQSILEVIFENKKASSYFESSYPNSSFVNKEFTGFKIEVNPTKSDMEEVVFGTDDKYKLIRLTIDKGKAKEAIENFKEESNDKKTIAQTDKNTNIKLEASTDVIPETTKLVANKITNGSAYNTALKVLNSETEEFILYDITLMNENATIQPNGKVKISLPIPNGYNVERISVYRVSENGEKVKYNTEISGSYITFETDHFSNYAIVQEKIKQDENVGKDDKVDNKKDDTVAPDKIPQTGEYIKVIISVIFVTAIISIILFYKAKKYKI